MHPSRLLSSPTAPEALEDDVILCCKCKIEVTIENMAAPKKVGSNVKAMRRNCHAVTTMLYRYLGTTLPEEWHQLTADQQQDFYRKCSAAKAASDGPLRYGSVRAILKESFVEISSTEDTTEVGGGYQPLSYWANPGYDTDKIEESAPREEHEFLGTTYLVPIKHTSVAEKKKRVERTLVECERNVKKRKDPELALPKPKTKRNENKENENPEPVPTLSEEQKKLKKSLEDFVDLRTDSEDEIQTATLLNSKKSQNSKAMYVP